MPKRSFDQFCQDGSQDYRKSKNVSAAQSTTDNNSPSSTSSSDANYLPAEEDEPSIRELLAAGWDIEVLKQEIFGLTNDIHPMFSEDKLCSCKHRDQRYCFMPHMAAALTLQTEGSIAPTWENPLDSFIIRSILQLATRIITHPDTLPFWSALWNRDEAPDDQDDVFHVRPRQKLTPSDVQRVHQRLDVVAAQVRWHFKNFVAVDPPEVGERENDRGETGHFKVEEGEPAFIANNPHRLIYGWRNGGPVAERTNFSHVWINTREMEDFDLSGDGWMDETITSLRRHVLHTAVGVVHELTHASLYIFSQYRESYCNQESVLEPGFAMENYVFGGHLERHKDGKVHICPWPNRKMGKLFPQRASEAPLPSHDKHVLEKDDWEPLLQDEFWDEAENRRGLREPRLKKLWLRKHGSHIKWSDWYSEKFRPADQTHKRRKLEEEGEDG